MAAAMARAPAACNKSGGFPVDKADASVHPAKLFIGGITRHTTTKQLRDHFSRYGRVLDCVAMRQPDGRPRGFGYVTLDSLAAADRCLAEPQVVDGRVVDMKRAVPEGSGSPIANMVGTPAAADCAHSHGADTLLGMSIRAPPPSLYEWPDSRIGGGSYFGAAPHLGSVLMPDIGPSSPLAGERLWSWGAPRTPEEAHHADGALDCVELLSRRCPAPPATLMGTMPSQTLSGVGPLSCDATRLDSVDLLVGGGHMASALGDQSPMATPPAALSGALSPTAPEFVPMCSREKADEKKPLTTAEAQQKARTALGEITNIVAGSPKDGIKQLSSLKGGLLGAKPLSSCGALGGISVGLGGFSQGLESLCTPAVKLTASKFEVLDDSIAQASKFEVLDDSIAQDSEEPPEESEEPAAAETAGASGESTPSAPESEEPLPSVGSAEHALGTCRRCNFFPKGRCQNGKDCTFCHFPHDKRKPSRQEKRERRAKWIAEHQGQALDEDDFDEDDEEDSEDGAPQVVAYPVLPGMPPTGAPKLPSPLALPTTCGFEAAAPGAPRLPPGLPPPPQRPSLDLWQPEEEISPQQFEVAFSPYGTPLHALQSLTPSAHMPPILATVPRSATSSLATSLAPSPVNASSADKKASFPPECQVVAEVQGTRSAPPTPASCTVGTLCTIGTQTEDADDKQQPEAALSAAGEDQRGTKSRSRRIWPRNELLQLRHLGSEPLKTSGEGSPGSGSATTVLFRTVARSDSKDGLC